MTVAPRSCASCGETGCVMHAKHGVFAPAAEQTSYILDDVWPEYASMVSSTAQPNDQIIAPGLLGRPGLDRYRWPGQPAHKASLATFRRHAEMRRVAEAPGGVRQRAYLAEDRKLGHALAQHIDYRARHLVVAQTWLPALEEAGVLGGRSYDVLMSRYPLGEVHRLLDRTAKQTGPSTTINDFRAPDSLVEREAALLSGARHIITPHHGIGALFPGQWLPLAWHRPEAKPHISGSRVAYIGSNLTRHRPDIVHELAAKLEEPLIVFGAKRGAQWEGIATEHRNMGADWLNDIGTIIQPAAMINQPRLLLSAQAAGITIYASNGCGLAPGDFRPVSDLVRVSA
ncbi:hypothetical protein [Alterisphingorhabdus coralli]|uniref:Uncharacterized protein n=1 Tax=Alterisphingorhabdus coralli TaxID=3071408 RepID=A0AA97HZQ9_9SPHN|nr:hypothetical protein [Parasphingorhabdus sp. SCSIO 66989]WOE74102.1 hypothetical protein RB602_09555 [Parasphingorhabdus sp. SCSIO 66989]